MESISPGELSRWLADPERAAPLLLDVRESWEHAICRIPGSRLVPMREIPAMAERLNPDEAMVVICHHGVRSLHTCRYLEQQGFRRTWNLSGGMAAWAREIDPAMATY